MSSLRKITRKQQSHRALAWVPPSWNLPFQVATFPFLQDALLKRETHWILVLLFLVLPGGRNLDLHPHPQSQGQKYLCPHL